MPPYFLEESGLGIRRVPGRAVRGHIVDLTGGKGVLGHELGSRRHEVGARRFDGAKRLHRALRVRPSLRRPPVATERSTAPGRRSTNPG